MIGINERPVGHPVATFAAPGRMRIALSFPGCHRRAGVERVVFECARFLAGRGHEVTVLADEWQADDAIRYQRVPMRRHPYFWAGRSYFSRCTRVVANGAFDVLGTHGTVCPTGGVHWVQSLHRAWLERSQAMRGRFSMGAVRQRLNPLHPVLLRLEEEHFANRAYQRLIATTPEVRRDLNRFYGVPEEDVEIIPNGFSPTEFNPERRAERRAEMRERLGLRPDDVALLFAANELDRKGYATILGALRLLASPRHKLLVVGRASGSAARALAARAGVADSVMVCGPTSDIAGYHAASDLFVLPTQYEAFSLAILESLGSGLPVVTTKVPGARDAIREGVNGMLLSDPRGAEELSAVLRKLTPDVVQGLSASTPETVDAYRWPNLLARYEAILAAYARL